MEKVFQEFEEWWHDLITDDVVLQTKKSIAANAFEAGWNAAQQGLHLTGGILPVLEASSTPQPLSGLEADSIPPTRK